MGELCNLNWYIIQPPPPPLLVLPRLTAPMLPPTPQDCELREVKAVRAIRAHNLSKLYDPSSGDGDTDLHAVFCVCHKPASDNMLQCSVCCDRFHGTCCEVCCDMFHDTCCEVCCDRFHGTCCEVCCEVCCDMFHDTCCEVCCDMFHGTCCEVCCDEQHLTV